MIIIYIINGINNYVEILKFDIGNSNIESIINFNNISISDDAPPLFYNVMNYVFYVQIHNNITKFNINNPDDITTFPFPYIRPTIQQGNKNLYIAQYNFNHIITILSIDTNNNIKTKIMENGIDIYPSFVQTKIYPHSITHIFNNTFYIALTRTKNDDSGLVFPFIRQFDENLNILYDIGFCNELYTITHDNNNLYILTQSTDNVEELSSD